MTIEVDDFLAGLFEVRVTPQEIIRGEEAWLRVFDANQFNDPPPPGFEYVLTRIRFEVLKGPSPDQQYDLNTFNFDAVSSDGKDLEPQFVVEPAPELRANLYPGASHEGWITFTVPAHDTAPLLTFGRDFQGRGGLWWKLYE